MGGRRKGVASPLDRGHVMRGPPCRQGSGTALVVLAGERSDARARSNGSCHGERRRHLRALTPSRITDTRAGSGYPNAGNTLGDGRIDQRPGDGRGRGADDRGYGGRRERDRGRTHCIELCDRLPGGHDAAGRLEPRLHHPETLANLATVPLGSQGGHHRLQLQRERQRRRRCRGLLHHSQPNERALQPRQPPPGVGHARRRNVDRPRRIDGGHGRRGGWRTGRCVGRGGQRHRGGFERAGIPHCRSRLRPPVRPPLQPPPT